MLMLVLVILLGNVLAIGVHLASWWLRRRVLSWFSVIGLLCLLLVILIFTLAWLTAGEQYDHLSVIAVDEVEQAREQRKVLLGGGAVLLSCSALALLQMRQIPASWLKTVFALFAEALVGILTAIAICNLIWKSPWHPNVTVTYGYVERFYILPFFPPTPGWEDWFWIAYIISLISLATARPWFKKIIPEFLQIRRDWFSLK